MSLRSHTRTPSHLTVTCAMAEAPISSRGGSDEETVRKKAREKLPTRSKQNRTDPIPVAVIRPGILCGPPLRCSVTPRSRSQLDHFAVHHRNRVPEFAQIRKVLRIEAHAGQSDFAVGLHPCPNPANSGLHRPTVSLEPPGFGQRGPGAKALEAHLVMKGPRKDVIHGILALPQGDAVQIPGCAGEKGKTDVRPGSGGRDHLNCALLHERALAPLRGHCG